MRVAVDEEVLGVPVKLCPAEEMVWSKGMIMERYSVDAVQAFELLRTTT